LSKSYKIFSEVLKMVAIAAKKRKAAIVLSEGEKLHLTNIASLNDSESAKKRAMILLCLGSMETNRDAAKACSVSDTRVSLIKKQWLESELTSSERINEICCGGNGRRKNDITLRNRMNNVLQFDRRLGPRVSIHERSQAIVEMAKKEGMSISVRTVTRFLEQHEKQQLANV
jgi:hypothetical protein